MLAAYIRRCRPGFMLPQNPVICSSVNLERFIPSASCSGKLYPFL